MDKKEVMKVVYLNLRVENSLFFMISNAPIGGEAQYPNKEIPY